VIKNAIRAEKKFLRHLIGDIGEKKKKGLGPGPVGT